MQSLHDPETRSMLRARIASLTPASRARWGRMSVEQMLWHVNGGLENALGRREFTPMKTPLPPAIMRFLVLRVPWPRGAPTLKEIDTAKLKPHCDFATEHERVMPLIEELAARDLNGVWPVHPTLGALTGADWSALHTKHVIHHLSQFNV
jgi:Protein of unknown function (DUF1569)